MGVLPTSQRIGNVITFFNGRVCIGPDWRLFVTSFCLILVGVVVFTAYTNTLDGARAVVAVSGVLSLFLLLLCGLSNPGISAKAPPPPPDAPPHESRWREVLYTKADGTIGQVKLEQKWCYSCHIYRPFRGIHCRFCDVCIARRDHHCPWTGICVGAGNYAAYVAFIWTTMVLLVTAFVGGLLSFIRRVQAASRDHDGQPQTQTSFLTALYATYCLEGILLMASLLWGALVVSLALYHLRLMTDNMTSGDAAREMEENVYDQGSVWANVKESLCGRPVITDDSWGHAASSLFPPQAESDELVREEDAVSVEIHDVSPK